VLSWRVGYRINIDYDNIVKERAIICAAWKWAGQKEVRAEAWDDQQDDKAVLQAFLEEAHSADELVGHNGDKFDLPWIKTRCLFHGLQTFPRYKTIDTLQWARRNFYFNSNRLDYLGKYLGCGGKIKTEFGLWKDVVLSNDREKLAQMMRYNKRDVVRLEQVYDKLAGHVSPKSHAGVMAGHEKWSCAYCGSEDAIVNKTRRVTAAGTVQKQMLCRGCGRYYSISMKSYVEYLEAKSKASTC
jgi:DNA polymerase III epsilon subunit-like protein